MYGYFPKPPLLTYVKKIVIDIVSYVLSRCITTFLKRKFDYSNIKRILIIRWCCIGDVLQTTPLIRALRKRFPDAQIDYMTNNWSRAVLENNPYLNSIINYRERSFSFLLYQQRLFRKENKKYDVVFVCDDSLFPILMAFFTGAKYRIGFNANNRGFLLTHSVKRYFGDKWHVIDAYLELGRIVGVKDEGMKMDMFLTQEEIAWAKKFIEEKKISLDRKIICIFPGGASNPGDVMPSRRWIPQRYGKVSEILHNIFDVEIILMGANSDLEIINEVKRYVSYDIKVIVGETTLRQVAAIIKHCHLLIGNDTGPLHMAAALGIPTICIFGPSDPLKHTPPGNEHIGLRGNIDCDPCNRITMGGAAICPNVPCMYSLTEDKVIEAAKRLISK
ncbi:MAG: lipopolysaccharide heptosyltransferase II [Chitinispirillaceae bacterium]|nr:lipopolysaccharide heptosyltransferase II [Chitinispirillaceae bacterium]